MSWPMTLPRAAFTWFSFICILSNCWECTFHAHRVPLDRSQKWFSLWTEPWRIRRRFALHREKVFHHKHFHFRFNRFRESHKTETRTQHQPNLKRNQQNPLVCTQFKSIKFYVRLFFSAFFGQYVISVCYPWLICNMLRALFMRHIWCYSFSIAFLINFLAYETNEM